MRLNSSKKCIVNFTFYLLLFLFLFQSEGISVEDNKGIFVGDDNVYRDLVEKSVVTYKDGCMAISYFVGIPADTMTFDEVVAGLKEKGIIGKRWKYKAEKPVTRGIMAYMGCRVLNIKGGLTMRTIDTTKRFTRLICSKLGIKGDFGLPDIGISKRYAYLELQDMGLVPAGHKKTFLTGHDLLALMYRMEQYIKSEEKEEEKEKEKSEESSE